MVFKKIAALFAHLKDQKQQSSYTIRAEALTDKGLARENNEDSYLCLPEYQLWAVADGMGGHEGGEIASAIAISSLKTAVASGKDLIAAIQYSHHAIEQAAIDGLGSKGMGSTIVAMQLMHDCYQIAWVGDSRAYLYHSELRCLSKDHSYVQLMLDQGLITNEDAESHPYKNTITQALGGLGKPVKVDTITGKLRQGDVFLLCSDGLSGKVSANKIEETLDDHATTLAEKANHLINKALEAGGEDNITLILLEVSH